MNMKKISIILYLSSLFSLLIYSYSQVDLNLTLSSNQLYQTFQHQLTYLGYFNRPLSTAIFIAILSSLVIGYWLLVRLASVGKLTTLEIIRLAVITTAVLIFSYPAFSYDIFNYIFDTRILIHHHLNPYQFTALDFPGDLWTRFMHWTHRTYPYGPTWLPLTAIFYLIGFGKFVPTLISFKLLGAISYLVSIFSLNKITSHLKPKTLNLSLALFAFNPLIIIEGLVSAHLDIAMAAIMLLSLGLLVSGKKITSWVLLFISVGIKYASLAALPLVFSLTNKSKQHSFQLFTLSSILISYLLTLAIISQREILPWYFIVPFALTVLVPKTKLTLAIMFALTFGALLRYAPYLYIGDYTPWVLNIRNWLTLVGAVLGGILSASVNQNPPVKST